MVKAKESSLAATAMGMKSRMHISSQRLEAPNRIHLARRFGLKGNLLEAGILQKNLKLLNAPFSGNISQGPGGHSRCISGVRGLGRA